MAVFKPTGSDDDCYAYDDTTLDRSSNYLYMGNDAGHIMDTGVRFTNITIPKESQILTAVVTFRALGSESGTTCRIRIFGYDIQDAPAFDTIGNFLGAGRTTQYKDWTPAAWTSGTDYDSEDVSNIIQHLVNGIAWVSGNDIVLFFEDWSSTNGAFRGARSYDSSTTLCPRLTITWTPPRPARANIMMF